MKNFKNVGRNVLPFVLIVGMGLLFFAGTTPIEALSSQPLSNVVSPNNLIQVVTAAPDGSSYIGGDFTVLGTANNNLNGVAELSASTAQPTANFPVPGDGFINSVVSDNVGGWYVGGAFTIYGGTTHNRLVHILANGAVDSNFNPSFNTEVRSVAFDGTNVYAGGFFNSVTGNNGTFAMNGLAAINTAGDVQYTSCNPLIQGSANNIAVGGGLVYIGGDFGNIAGAIRNSAAAFDFSSCSATNFNPLPTAFGSTINSFVISGSTVYVLGNFTTIGGASRNGIAALDSATGNATSWNPAPTGSVGTMALSGSTLYVGGSFTAIGGQSRNRIAALNTSDALATSFNPNANSSVGSMSVQGTTLYVGGAFTNVGGGDRAFVAGIDMGTGSATSWAPNPNGSAGIAAANGSKVFITGTFTGTSASIRTRLAHILANGTVDTSFNPNVNGIVRTILIDGSTIYFGGDFTSVNGTTRNKLAAVTTTGTLVTTWNPCANGIVTSISKSSTTLNYYIGGLFTQIGGTGCGTALATTRNRLAAVNSTGVLNTTWNPNANSSVWTVNAQGSTVYVGGAFTLLGATTRNRIAQLDASTGAIQVWNPCANAQVMSIAVTGTDVYYGGSFTAVGGTGCSFTTAATRNAIAAVSPGPAAAALRSLWNPSITGGGAMVNSVVVNGSNLYVGGDFTTIGATGRNNLAQISAATGSAATIDAWNPNVTGGAVASVGVVDANNLYAGGYFTTVSGNSKKYFAKFGNDTVAPTVGAVTPTNPSTGVSTAFVTTYSDANGVASCSFYVDAVLQGGATLSNPNGTSGTATYSYTFTSQGAHTAQFRCNDTSNNAGNGSVTNLNVQGPDTTPPTFDPAIHATGYGVGIAVVNVANGFFDYVTDNIKVQECDQYIVDGTAFGPNPPATNLTIAGATDTFKTVSVSPLTFTTTGVHTLQIRCKDSSNNSALSPIFEIHVYPSDAIAPTVGAVTPITATANVSATFSADYSDDNVVYACYALLDGGSKGIPFPTLSGPFDASGTASVSLSLTAGTHTVQINCSDGSNNSGSGVVTTINAVGDTVSPMVGSVTPTTATPNVATTFSTSYSDNTGVGSCSFWADGSQVYIGTQPAAATLSNPNGVSGTATFAYTFTSSGIHTAQFRCLDLSGNTGAGTVTNINVGSDAIPPDTSIASLVDGNSNSVANGGFSNSTQATLSFSGTDNVAVTGFECQIDNGGFSPCSSPKLYTGLISGNHAFQVRAMDAVGNVDATPAAWNWTVDTASPIGTVTINNGDTYTNTQNTTLTLTCSDTQSGCVQMQIATDGTADTEPFEIFAASKNVTLPAGDGTKTVAVKFKDGAGNVSTQATDTITLDTVTPNSATDSTPASLTASDSASFTFHATEAGSTFECKLDGGNFAPCSSPVPYSGLSDGSHTFQVRAIDPAGNTDASPASFTWTVDTTSPTVTNPQVTPSIAGTTASITITKTVTDVVGVANITTTIGGPMPATAPIGVTTLTLQSGTPQNGVWSGTFEFPSATQAPDGTYVLTDTATDTVGNATVVSNGTVLLDRTMPTISIVTITPSVSKSTNHVTVTVSASDITSGFESQDSVTAKDDTTGVAATRTAFTGSLAAGQSGTWTFDQAAGTPEGSHVEKATGIDKAGNINTVSGSYNVDDTAPDTVIDSLPAVISNSNSADFTFHATENNSSFECKLDNGSFAPCSSPAGYTNLGDGSHVFQVRATDTAGNTDSTPESFSWTVDTVAPSTTLASTPLSLSASASASFTLTASEAGSTFECSLDASDFLPCASPVSYSNLSDGTHTFQVRATDVAGNTNGTPTSFTWTIDTIPPSVTNATVTPSITGTTAQITITKTVTDDVGVASVKATVKGPTPSTTSVGIIDLSLQSGTAQNGVWSGVFTFPSLDQAPDGTYTVTDTAKDTAGNVVDVTDGSALLDRTMPIISIVTITPSVTQSTGHVTVTVAASDITSGFADQDSVTAKDITSNIDATFVSFDGSLLPGGSGTWVFDQLAGTPEGVHVERATAKDKANNTNSISGNYLVDDSAPTTTIDTSPSNLSNSGDANFSFHSNEANSTFECKIDSGDFLPCTSPTDFFSLNDGARTFLVRATDEAGNTNGTPTSFSWTIDTTPPSVTSVTVTPSITGTVAQLTITKTVVDAVGLSSVKATIKGPTPSTTSIGTIDLSLQSGTAQNGVWSGVFSFPSPSLAPDGTYVVTDTAKDMAGNIAEVTDGSALLDRTMPIISIVTITPSVTKSTGHVTVTVAASDITSGFASQDSVTAKDVTTGVAATRTSFTGSLAAGQSGTWIFDQAAGSPEGAHTETATATDRAGNVNSDSGSYIVDDTAPDTVVDSTPSDPSTVDSASFTFHATETSSTFECNLDGGNFTPCSSAASYSSISDGAHTFQVRATDAAGNTDATPASFTWTITPQDYDHDGIVNNQDQCPRTYGVATRGGCPYADDTKVYLHTVDQQKSGVCGLEPNGKPRSECKKAVSGALVKVFDRELPDFLTVYGSKKPKKDILNVIYETGVGQVGQCITGTDGRCIAGEDHPGKFLVIAKYVDGSNSVYTGKFKNFKKKIIREYQEAEDDDDDDDKINPKYYTIHKNLRVLKVIDKKGDVKYHAGDMTVVSGSELDIIRPDYVVWDGATQLYPFIMTSQNDWTLDICMQVPQGYKVQGVLDVDGNMVTKSDCAQALVAGEPVIILFSIQDVGSPEPDLTLSFTANHQGKITKHTTVLQGIRKKSKTVIDKDLLGKADKVKKSKKSATDNTVQPSDVLSLLKRDLGLGSRGADVKMLQRFLNSAGFPVALKGPGSVGNETELFGLSTKAALKKFQVANDSKLGSARKFAKGKGFLDPVTRSFISGMQFLKNLALK